jgi:hypothetical protein
MATVAGAPEVTDPETMLKETSFTDETGTDDALSPPLTTSVLFPTKTLSSETAALSEL